MLHKPISILRDVYDNFVLKTFIPIFRQWSFYAEILFLLGCSSTSWTNTSGIYLRNRKSLAPDPSLRWQNTHLGFVSSCGVLPKDKCIKPTQYTLWRCKFILCSYSLFVVCPFIWLISYTHLQNPSNPNFQCLPYLANFRNFCPTELKTLIFVSTANDTPKHFFFISHGTSWKYF